MGFHKKKGARRPVSGVRKETPDTLFSLTDSPFEEWNTDVNLNSSLTPAAALDQSRKSVWQTRTYSKERGSQISPHLKKMVLPDLEVTFPTPREKPKYRWVDLSGLDITADPHRDAFEIEHMEKQRMRKKKQEMFVKMSQAAVTNQAVTNRILETHDDMDFILCGTRPDDKVSDFSAYAKLPAIPVEALVGTMRPELPPIVQPTYSPPLAFLTDTGEIRRPYKEPKSPKPPKKERKRKSTEVKPVEFTPTPWKPSLMQLPSLIPNRKAAPQKTAKIIKTTRPDPMWTNYMRDVEPVFKNKNKNQSQCGGTSTPSFDVQKLDTVAKPSFKVELP